MTVYTENPEAPTQALLEVTRASGGRGAEARAVQDAGLRQRVWATERGRGKALRGPKTTEYLCVNLRKHVKTCMLKTTKHP